MDVRNPRRFLRLFFLAITLLSQPLSAQDVFQCNYTTDIDQDDDGLIELCDLNALDAIRYQLDGSGYRESSDAVKITAGCPSRGCDGYELRSDLDFNADDSYRDTTSKEAWTSGLGWLPIGDQLNSFSARFEGNDHMIANLYINRPSDYVGLFRATAKLAKISDLVLSQTNIKGNSYVGSLAGHNAGGVASIDVEGGQLIGAGNNVGGLSGANAGTILNGEVMLEHVESDGHSVGGLVGHNEGYITHSVADTSLLGVSQVGGLIGLNSSGILGNNRADGIAKGDDYVGGLVGLNRGRISASHAEGKVISDGSYSGGLVGANDREGKIADSRASGAVSSNLYAGGLVGWNKDGEITNSFALSRVDANSDVGGLVGWNEGGQIRNAYASGSVDGVYRVGGLVGSNKGIVSDSFANGRVVASGEHGGGLVGWSYAHQTRHATAVRVIHSYWDSEVVGILLSAGGSLRSTEQLRSPTAPGLLGGTFEIWDTADWEFGTSEQYPILRHSEGANKGHLLPGQQSLLSGLLVLDGLTLSPAFDAQTFDYRMNLSDDSVGQIRFSPTIANSTQTIANSTQTVANSTQTISVIKDEEISLPSVRSGDTVAINLNVAPQPTLITIARHYRIWVIRRSGLEATINSHRSEHRVNEGQSIAFDVSSSEPDPRRVSYRWSQVSPTQPNLLTDLNTRQAELNIDIPDDFVVQDFDETVVMLQVEASANGTSVVRNTTITVVKTNGGGISTLAAPTHRNGTLTIADMSEADLSMEPDGGVDLSSFRYQWQYKLPSTSTVWQDIQDATQMRYEIPQVLSVINDVRYRVLLDYRDNQGHRHRIVSESLVLMRIVDDDDFTDIYYLEDLYAIRNQLDGRYELVRDLDFNSDASYRDPINKAKWTVADYEDSADTGWLPIGSLIYHFTGAFRGNGYTIFNLQINRDTADYQGLFAFLRSGSAIRNVGLLNVRIEGGRYVGGLAGLNRGTIINGHVVGEFSGNSLVGGIAGENSGKVINSYASSAMLRGGSHFGGLVGTNQGLVINSHATAQILAGQTINSGGLIGWNAMNASVINSYASGDIRSASPIGGLIGINRGSITNSYATGNVSGSGVGGLVGNNQLSTAMITNSYATGNVSGSGGGLVSDNVGVISASYWNIETSGLQGSHGSGQTTRQMQSPTMATGIFEAWDDGDWDFGNSEQYPILKYAPGPDGDGCSMSGLLAGLPQCGELISPRLRYGLRSLATADGASLSPEFTLSPAFNVGELNQSGIYIGTLRSTDNTIRLMPTTIEPTAHISFYIGNDETAHDRIRSGETSKAISLKENDMTRIHVEMQGTQTVRYTLYIDYSSTTTDEGLIMINYLEDLRAIYRQPRASYKLARDLDFADHESYLDPLNGISWTVDDYDDASDTGWVPIGSESEPFAGSFDGDGYTISGLQINRDTTDNQGLFGVTSSSAVISNIGLLNAKLEGRAKVAGLVGTNQGQVGYSYVVGNIKAESRLGTAGGLVASNDGGDIIGSYAISEVSGAPPLGGLVGDNDGRIINSYADTIIMSVGSVGSGFGGLVGRNRSLIANSYATGKILASGSSIIGGLVGQGDQGAQIINGYASVSIEGGVSGALVGYNVGSIENSYAIGELSGGRVEGSLVGISEGGRIIASYWNTDTISVGSNHGIGQTTLQLQSATPTRPANSIYEDWDSSDWDFGTTQQYPILKHTAATGSIFGCGSPRMPRCGNLISPGLRYGLRGLRSASDAIFYPPIDIERLNRSGIYIGTVIGNQPSVRLIPVVMESTARISIIGTRRETINSHETSLPIPLKKDDAQAVIVEVEGTQTVRYTLYLNYMHHRVIDEDGDGLVDINYLEDLDAIRHQLDGSGYRADAEAFKVTLGCPSEGCKGYELLRDLDFNDTGSYRNADENMRRWTGAGAWQSIAGAFVGTFKGNNKTIANLKVRGSGGLFAAIGSDERVAHIDGIGLLGVDIRAGAAAGIALSCQQCTISNSYVVGNIAGNTNAAGLLNTISATSDGVGGGLARISNSYFIGNLVVNGRSAVGGGLIGNVDADLSITDSYAVGRITAQHDDGFIGSLVGARTSSIIQISNSYTSVLATQGGEPQGLFGGNKNPKDQLAPTAQASYIDTDVSATEVTLGQSKRTVELQSPTSATDIYARWGSDGLGNSDNWDFGSDKQYPAIKYNLRGNVMPISDGDTHCGAADIQKRPAACQTVLRHQGSLLQDLKLPEGAGLSRSFAFASFDYAMSVNADQSSIRLFATAFNAVARVEVFKDGNLLGASSSSEWTVPIPLNDHANTVVDLVVTEGNRRSYRYQFTVNRLSIVAENIDKDGDGLIDISHAAHLNAIRNRLDGSAYQESGAGDVIYCSNGCAGYELTADIDLGGILWWPIGFDKQFTSVLKGNGHTISNLTIRAGNTNKVGLFATIGEGGRVENVGLENVNITGHSDVGSIAGHNSGTIINSYASGRLTARANTGGGLVGRNRRGTLVNSYADVGVDASSLYAGGLVGWSRIRSSIVNSYAVGDVQINSGAAGGLVGGNHDASIHNSYATGEVRADNENAGGLVAQTGRGHVIVNSHYRTGAVISGTDALIGTARTEMQLKAGVPGFGPTYIGWDRADWHFGNSEQYPALLYTAGNGNNAACRQPAAQQVSDCNGRLSANLSGHDKAIVCRSHLPRSPEQIPYCGALLPGQRSGLLALDFSENAHLTPPFSSQIYDYELLVDADIEILRTTPTGYYGSDTITIDAGGLSSLTGSGQGSSFTLSDDLGDDLDSIVFKVQSATPGVPTVYTIKVLQDIAVVDGFIMIDYLEDLNLMRNSLAQVSAPFADCPIDTQDNVRRCRGYKLARDLDFKDPTSYRAGVVNPMWTGGAGWQPIGEYNPNQGLWGFRDLFSGDGHMISNLRIHGVATGDMGLFDRIGRGGRIENVGLLVVDINVDNSRRSLSSVGALLGSNLGEVVNSYVIGGNVQGDYLVGGLVGENSDSANPDATGVIVNSYANVSVNGRVAIAGGLVGTGAHGGKIRNSYASGAVVGNEIVGGLAGIMARDINNGYASGDVSGTLQVGSLVGFLSEAGMVVSNSYATGKVTGSSRGLFGSVLSGSRATASYWDISTGGVADDTNSANGIGKTTAELQTPAIGGGIYRGWDSDDWYSVVGQYPVLRYTSATDVLARPACRAAEDTSSEMPVCGSLLSAQHLSGLRSLALSNNTGQILLLRPDFNPGIYDYELILKSDAREFTIIPNTFNTNAMIIVTDDSGTNPRRVLRSGQATTLVMDNINDFLLTLTVEDPPLPGTTTTTRYRFELSKHPLINVNDIDEDDDGLIEIGSIDDMNIMRYQLDGSGYRVKHDDIKITKGCPNDTCLGYELTRDLDFRDATSYRSGVVNTEWAENWQPIGMRDNPFGGVFNGNKHTISNLRINRSDTDNVGLFAALADGAQIKNINLSDVEVGGRIGVGSLAAHNAGEIDNSYANGMVAGERAVGGLVAYNSGRISNSYTYGVVSGGSMIGGLVARNESGGMIANSYSLSRVSGNDDVGGLVGLNLSSIANTYASGDVQGKTRMGGLVGENGGSVRDSYATSNILCAGVPACATYVVATGGLIGSNAGGTVVNSYWDIVASNMPDNMQVLSAGIGKTTLQLQSGTSQSSDASEAYYRWDDNDWHFGNVSQYPILKYTSTTESMLTGLQSYGLESLTIAELVTLSPHFDTTKLYYRVGVELDANIQHLHLIPSALNTEATIRIVSDNGFDETVASGTSSSAIVLHPTDTTVIDVEVSGERHVRYRFEVDYFSSGLNRNVDADGDELIEILTLEDLDAMRNVLDGRLLRQQNDEGIFVENARGCPITGCRGYELLQDLDFDNPAHYRTGRVNTAWTSGVGWQPIGTLQHPFVTTFKGNGYTISNLRVNRPNSDGGLFGVIDGSETNAAIEGLGLSDVDIVGGAHVGGLVGHNRAGNISQSYVTGSVLTTGKDGSAIVGGLVGYNVGGSITESYAETQVKGNLADSLTTSLAGGLVALNDDHGRIENSYAIGSVISRGSVGGLVALNQSSSEIINSYAVSRATAMGATSMTGGLVAVNNATVDDSYWDMEASGVASSAGGISATTEILQSSTPTSPINSVYRNWDADVWEFADADRYPTLKAVNNAQLLASEGKGLLQSLRLLGYVGLLPLFHPLIFDYDLIAQSHRMVEVQLNATSQRAGTTIDIACSDGLACSSGIPTSFALGGGRTSQITITTHTPDAGELSYKLSVRYPPWEIRRATATTTTPISMPLTMAEGEHVRLIASYDLGLSEDLYRYNWRQTGGDVLRFNDALSPVDTRNAILDFTVPVDIVSKQSDSRSVQLIIDIGVANNLYLSEGIPLIISKRNNDSGNRARLLKDNNKIHTYAVRFEREDGSEFLDQDKGLASIDLQWQRRRSDAEDWVNVGSGSPYTLPNEGNYQYRALATYEDNQGYREQFETEVIDYLDIDEDGDGLIEITYLEELDAMRHQLDGSGYKATASANEVTAGCPVVNNVEKCRGYELMNDLDFTDDASYRTSDTAALSVLKNSWTVSDFKNSGDVSWQPIGEPFNAVFNGNGYTISNMQINRSVDDTENVGLFSRIGAAGRIENLGLVDPAIKGLIGAKDVGGIAGQTDSKSIILNSYVVGDVAAGNTDKIISSDVGFGYTGGLIGNNAGYILNSYAEINVITDDSGTLRSRDKSVIIGGLVGRNFAAKVHNSYATGEVKGPCEAGGLVGLQTRSSEIKNAYATGDVATRSGTCSNSNKIWVGGLVGINSSSKLENSYALGAVSGSGTRSGGLVGEVFPNRSNSVANPVNSYWSFDANCRYVANNPVLNFIPPGMYCYSRRVTTNPLNARLETRLRSATMPDTTDLSCVDTGNRSYSCQTYTNWNTADWDFGTKQQYPALKYGIGSDTENPGCGNDAETELPSCNALLNGQIADALLLNSLSLSANSKEVRLTPGFLPSRFNYQAMIELETFPSIINIATDATSGTTITIRKDGGTPLVKRSDGSVQIITNDSFNLEIKAARGNEREASYQIQVRLRHPPQLNIFKVVNGSAPIELTTRDIFVLDEGDVVRLDASKSFGQNNSPLNYQWTQVSGKPLLSRIETTSTLGFIVPADFVARDADEIMVMLKLELSERDNPASTVSREILLPVRKINNGNVQSAVKWISSDTLSADDLSEDVDGGVLGDIGYQWLVEQNGGFVAIPGANQRIYTPSEDTRNAQYRFSISYTDAQGYETNIHYDAPLYADIATHKDKDGDGLIEIETVEDLDAIRYQLDGSGYRASSTANKITNGCPDGRCTGYELTRSLDFMDDNSYRIPSSKSRYIVTTTTELGWQPVGNSSLMSFSAAFDGNGYTISNLMINRTGTRYVGLFGYTGTAAKIANLGLLDVDISGRSFVASLVGNNNGTIISSHSTGTVSGRLDIGGLVGVNQGGTITNSHAMGTVSGRLDIGGLVGQNDNGSITNSYAIAEVKGSSNRVGGLAGRNDNGTIMSSYAAGKVDGEDDVGGLVGQNENGTIMNSYATSDVSGLSNASNLVGSNTGSITNSYTTGDVTVAGRAQTLGLVAATSKDVNHSYWLSGSAALGGIINALGRIDAEKTAEELRSPTQPGTSTSTDVYYNWDVAVWDFGTAKEYPALKYHDNNCGNSMPFADCGKLLLHQRVGLRDLKLEQNVEAGHLHLSPDFDNAVTTYTMSVRADAKELRIIPIAVNPDAIIVADGKVLPADNSGYTFALNPSGPTSTVISVAASNSIATEEPVVYKLTVNNRLPRISINAAASIREGETFAFNATIEDAEGDEFNHSLSMAPNFNICRGRLVCPPVISTGTVVGHADLRHEFNIPSDLLGEMQSTTEVEIVLTVDDGLNFVSETMQLTIVKGNEGVISLPAPTLDRFTYTIAGIDLSSDSDGINPKPEIAYQWQRELLGSWSDIDDATDASYTVEGIIGDRYRVLVDYTDKQGYRHQGIVSSAVSAPQQFVYNIERTTNDLRSTTIKMMADGLMPDFEQDTTEYKVPSNTTNVQVIMALQEGEKASINDMPLAIGETQKTLPLDFGNNEITIVIRDENNSTQNYVIFRDFDLSLYRWSVGWQGPAAQTLDFLGSNLEPDPLPRIPNDIDSVTVTATVEAMIQVAISSAGNTVGSVTTSTDEGGRLVAQATIDDLALGENDVEFLLTAPDSSTTSYTAKVWRRYSSRLISLAISGLSPAFNSEVFEYTASSVSNHVRAVTLSFEAHEGATVFVQGAGTSGNSVPITFADIGENIVPIRVAAPREQSTTYTIMITRQHSLNLRSLDVTDVAMTMVALSPSFVANIRMYDAKVFNETSQVRVTFATDLRVDSRLSAPTTPTISEKSILNNDSDDRIETTALVPLDFDENLITIRTSALGMRQVTTLTIVRPIRDDAELIDLQLLDLNGINLLTDFASSTQDYMLTVSNSTTEIEVIATAPPSAKIKLDIAGEEDIATATGTISNKFELRETGMENQLRIRIVVTVDAQDEITTQGYTVLVTRSDPPSMNVDLETIGFEVDREGNGTYTPLPVELISPEADDGTTYTATIKSIEGLKVRNIIRIRISPQASDDGATISINDGIAATAPTLDITLSAALDTPEAAISIRVMQNGAAETYSLIITRERDPTIRLRIKVFLEGPLQ